MLGEKVNIFEIKLLTMVLVRLGVYAVTLNSNSKYKQVNIHQTGQNPQLLTNIAVYEFFSMLRFMTIVYLYVIGFLKMQLW